MGAIYSQFLVFAFLNIWVICITMPRRYFEYCFNAFNKIFRPGSGTVFSKLRGHKGRSRGTKDRKARRSSSAEILSFNLGIN